MTLGLSSKGLRSSTGVLLPLCIKAVILRRHTTPKDVRFLTGNEIFLDTPRQQTSGKSMERLTEMSWFFVQGVTIAVLGVLSSRVQSHQQQKVSQSSSF